MTDAKPRIIRYVAYLLDWHVFGGDLAVISAILGLVALRVIYVFNLGAPSPNGAQDRYNRPNDR